MAQLSPFEFESRSIFGNDITSFNILPHQIDSIRWMIYICEMYLRDRSRLPGLILADEMGLGKTRDTAGFVEVRLKDKVLIAVIKTTIYQWYMETLSVSRSYRVFTYENSDFWEVTFSGVGTDIRNLKIEKRRVEKLPDVRLILIVSYEAIINILERINVFTWDYIIGDEIDKLRNGISKETVNYEALSSVRIGDDTISLFLSGSPLHNGINDLISIYKLIDSSLDINTSSLNDTKIAFVKNLNRKYLFRRTNDQINKYVKRSIGIPEHPPIQHNYSITIPETDLSKRLEELTYRKIRHLIEGEPELIDQILEDELAYYIVCASYIFNRRLKQEQSSSVNLEITTDLLLLTNCPYEMKIPILKNQEYRGTCSKFNKIIDLIKEKDLKSFIVFVHYKDEREKIMELINVKYPYFNSYYIDGDTPLKLRHEIMMDTIKHTERDEPFFVILSIRVASHGLNFQHVNNVLFPSRDWDPQVENQGKARVHRTGQKKEVHVYNLSVNVFKIFEREINIDERIKEVKESKEPIAEIIEVKNAAWFFKRFEFTYKDKVMKSYSVKYKGHEYDKVDTVEPIEYIPPPRTIRASLVPTVLRGGMSLLRR